MISPKIFNIKMFTKDEWVIFTINRTHNYVCVSN